MPTPPFNILLPQEFIDAYGRAKDTHIRSEERTRDWYRAELELFTNALQALVDAALASTEHNTHMGVALTALRSIQSGRRLSMSERVQFTGPARVTLQREFIDLFMEARTAYKQYIKTVGTFRRSLIVGFRDALDHIVDIADASDGTGDDGQNLTLSFEHLVMVGSDSYELAVNVLRRRATRRLRFKRLIRNRLPNASTTNAQLIAIADNVAMGRLRKGRVDAWRDCFNHLRAGFEAAFALEHNVAIAPLRLWSVLGLGITGSLIAAALGALAVAVVSRL